jgi:hypothetical protein
MTLMIFGILLAPLSAGDTDRTGTAGAMQLLVPVGARAMAMGGSNIATTTGIDAIYWNPAGLAKSEYRFSSAVSTFTIFNDIHLNYFAFGAKAGNLGHFGFSIKAFDIGSIPVTTLEDYDGELGVTYSPTMMTMAGTYSRLLTNTISVGLNTKLIYESIPGASASAVAFDIGIQYRNLGGIAGLDFGVVMNNIGTNLEYSGSRLLVKADEQGAYYSDYRTRPVASNDLPANIELGMGYTRMVAENQELNTSMVFKSNNYGYDNYRLGAEYAYNKQFFVRGGYTYDMSIDSDARLYGVTFGAGMMYKMGGVNMYFDYVFRPVQYFNAENMFQIKVGL